MCHPSGTSEFALVDLTSMYSDDCATDAMPRAIAKTTHFARQSELGGFSIEGVRLALLNLELVKQTPKR